MRKSIHILYGQGGYITSIGMNTFGRSLDPAKYSVRFWNYDQHRECQRVLDAATEKSALIGYSLGGNACAWIAHSTKHPIDLLVAYDPTANGPPLSQFPIRKHVKRAICYQQTGYVFFSMFFGRGLLVRAPDGPPIITHKFTADHLYVPYMASLHNMTKAALEMM